MKPTDRPWWSSDGSAGAGTEPDVDPVEAHRAARRGAPDTVADPAGEAPPTGEGHHPDICGVCPICVTARFLEDARPELMEHLTEAARHLAAAFRAAVEPAADHASGGGGAEDGDGRRAGSRRGPPGPPGPDAPPRVRRIDLD